MSKPTNAIAKIDQFKEVLNSQTIRAQLKNSLKEHSGAFLSSMLDLYSSDKYLQGCDPKKVAMECIKAASLELPIVKSLGFAYVVAYKGEPTFIIGYKGLIQLAQRSGAYKTINADVVYEGELTSQDKLSGSIELGGEAVSEKVVGYFAYFKLLSGFEKVVYMTKEEVIAHAKRYSPSFGHANGPWQTEFDSMALKTVLRKLISKYGPMSTQMAEAVQEDSKADKVERTINENANNDVIDITVEQEDEKVIEAISNGQTVLVDTATGEVKNKKAAVPNPEF